jgi:hypothetical protein
VRWLREAFEEVCALCGEAPGLRCGIRNQLWCPPGVSGCFYCGSQVHAPNATRGEVCPFKQNFLGHGACTFCLTPLWLCGADQGDSRSHQDGCQERRGHLMKDLAVTVGRNAMIRSDFSNYLGTLAGYQFRPLPAISGQYGTDVEFNAVLEWLIRTTLDTSATPLLFLLASYVRHRCQTTLSQPPWAKLLCPSMPAAITVSSTPLATR